MKVWPKVFLCVALSVMCVFTCVGYAATSETMHIHGSGQLTPPEELFITGVSGGAYIDPATLAYTGTIVSSDLTLMPDASGKYVASFTVEVWNNTNLSYYYHSMVRGTYTTADGTVVAYDNEDIVLDVDDATLKKGDEVAPGQRKTFTVNASFKDGVKPATASKELFSIINYYFSTTRPDPEDDGGGEAAVTGVLARFPEILNHDGDYKTLTDALDANTTHPDYIGNVVGFWGFNNDIATVENLFGVALELNVDGENKPVTVIIQRDNVDGNEATGDDYTYTKGWGSNASTVTVKGNEMILFMTAVDLESVSRGAYIEVFAVVYTRADDQSEWKQLGDMYRGSAQAVGYVFGTTLTHDSFNPNTWRQLDSNGNRTNTTLSNIIQALPKN